MLAFLTGSTWRGRAKHYLGAPVPGATIATVNLAHVMAAVDFLAEVTVEPPRDDAILTREEIVADLAEGASDAEIMERREE